MSRKTPDGMGGAGETNEAGMADWAAAETGEGALAVPEQACCWYVQSLWRLPANNVATVAVLSPLAAPIDLVADSDTDAELTLAVCISMATNCGAERTLLPPGTVYRMYGTNLRTLSAELASTAMQRHTRLCVARSDCSSSTPDAEGTDERICLLFKCTDGGWTVRRAMRCSRSAACGSSQSAA
eukprot:4756631-Pleurochrysis_carterae.AAC.1